MKKLFLSLLSIVLLLTAACSSQSTGQTEVPSPSPTTAIGQPTEQLPPTPESVTLEGENEYMIVDAIDISDCTLENGYFSGMMTFTSHTTQKYIDEYGDYFYRQIYFGFYNENGDLLNEGSVTLAFMRSSDHKPCRIPEFLKELLRPHFPLQAK